MFGYLNVLFVSCSQRLQHVVESYRAEDIETNSKFYYFNCSNVAQRRFTHGIQDVSLIISLLY
jgi:hypothetical protein